MFDIRFFCIWFISASRSETLTANTLCPTDVFFKRYFWLWRVWSTRLHKRPRSPPPQPPDVSLSAIICENLRLSGRQVFFRLSFFFLNRRLINTLIQRLVQRLSLFLFTRGTMETLVLDGLNKCELSSIMQQDLRLYSCSTSPRTLRPLPD